MRQPTKPQALMHTAPSQEARNWDAMGATEPRKGGAKGEKQLDFSADGPADGPAAAPLAPLAIGKSRVDADEDDYSSEEEEGDSEVRVPRGESAWESHSGLEVLGQAWYGRRQTDSGLADALRRS